LSLNGNNPKKDAERAELARLTAEFEQRGGTVCRGPSILWAHTFCAFCGLHRTTTADYAKRMMRKCVRCGSEKIRVSY
jgi:hypothetical protein